MRCTECGFNNPEGTKFCGDCAASLSPSIPYNSRSSTKTLITPPSSLMMGTTFAGRYQIIETLGSGGMGQVLKVVDSEINETVALKLLHPEISSDPATIARFSNELKLARKIIHKNICRMYHLGREKATYYITMEYVSGEDLKSFVKRSGVLTVRKAVHIGVQTCEGLSEAHGMEVIHRDLKPQNIMIDQDGNTKIMDFGIAHSTRAKAITGTGAIIGTPEYMSPEQAEGTTLDTRSDIYSLGVILFEMVTGVRPFEGDTPLSIALKHKSELPPKPKSLNSQIPDSLNQVILKCLEKDRDKRYQSAEKLLSDLLSLERALPTTSKFQPKQKAKTSTKLAIRFNSKKRFLPIAAAIAIAAFFILLRVSIKQSGIPPPETTPSMAVIGFENQTGNVMYDYLRKVIPSLLISSLEQSRYLQVVTWERLHDLIRSSGMEDVESIDQELGFHLCEMEGIDVIVLGFFTKAGDVFATDVKVLDVRTKSLIMSASSKGEGMGSILAHQIDELSKNISKGIGLSDKKIRADQKQIADVTTSSLEAYEYFLKGIEANDNLYHNDARKHLEKAVDLDPEFAIAYSYLSDVNSSLQNYDLAQDQLKKARSLSAKATEKEKLYIEARYSLMVENDGDKYQKILHDITNRFPLEKRGWYQLGLRQRGTKPHKAIEIFQKALDLDPGYGPALNAQAYTYMRINDYKKALECFNRYSAANPGDANPIDSTAELYYKTGKLEQSAVKYSEAVEIKPDFISSLRNGSFVFMLLEKYPNALDFIQKYIEAAPSPTIRVQGLWIKAFLHFWLGRLEQAQSDYRVLLELEDTMGTDSRKVRSLYMLMWIHFEKGEYDSGKEAQEDMLHLLKDESGELSSYWKARSLYFLGLVDLKENDIGSAKLRLKEMHDYFPKIQRNLDRVIIRSNLLNAEILLAEKNYSKAVVFCEKELSLIRSSPTYDFNFNIPINVDNSDILARAYHKAGKLDQAISEYERLLTLDPDDPRDRFPVNPLYHFRIARILEEKGLISRAIEQYTKFLEIWENADPGRYVITETKNRLTSLKKGREKSFGGDPQ